MTVLHADARQNVKYAFVRYTYADALTGVFLPLVNLPIGALIVYGESVVETADNGGTSAVIDVGYSGAANTYLNDDDAKSAGRTAFTSLGTAPLTAQRTVGVTRTEGGTASTAGVFWLVVGYLEPGRSDAVRELNA